MTNSPHSCSMMRVSCLNYQNNTAHRQKILEDIYKQCEIFNDLKVETWTSNPVTFLIALSGELTGVGNEGNRRKKF